MFTDARSKKVVLVAHCFLNQNSISDGTADYPGAINEVMKRLLEMNIGIIQMPCPELLCLGLDRGDIHGAEQPVVMENTRIRAALGQPVAQETIRVLVRQLVYQIEEYRRNGFTILGIIGVNRSPSCGVNTTSSDNREVPGEGVFIQELRNALERRGIELKMTGIKAGEIGAALERINALVRGA